MKRLFVFCLSLLTLASCLPLKQQYIEITSSSPMTVLSMGGYETIGYIINTQIDGAEVEARANVSWITDISVDYSTVSFTVATNDTDSERRAVVTLSYANEEIDVTIIQPALDLNVEGLGNKAIRYTTNDGKIAGPVPSEADAENYYAKYGAWLKANIYTEEGGMIIFEEDVTNIPYEMFEDAYNLVSIDIPESVEWISQNAFLYCENLSEVTLHEGLIGISGFAFQGCENLTTLTIPESVEEIGNNIVLRCENFREFRGVYASEDGHSLIKDNTLYAFAPAGLTQYAVPDGVTKIAAHAFEDIYNITHVSLSQSVTEVENSAFAGCVNLESFGGKFAADGGRALIIGERFVAVAPAGLKSYTIPNGIKEIGGGAFGGIDKLTEIIIPDEVETIGDQAFFSFEGTSIKLPSALTFIGLQAFAYSRLESITLPASLESIDSYAFEYSWDLKSVYSEPTNPPYLGERGFADGAEDRKIYVPAESVELYKSEGYGWSDYAHEIVAM